MRNGKESPNQKTGLGNRGPLEAINDPKVVVNEEVVNHAKLGIILNLQISPIPQT